MAAPVYSTNIAKSTPKNRKEKNKKRIYSRAPYHPRPFPARLFARLRSISGRRVYVKLHGRGLRRPSAGRIASTAKTLRSGNLYSKARKSGERNQLTTCAKNLIQKTIGVTNAGQH